MTTADSPRRADAQRNRDRLLAATEDLLARRGIGVSMDEIARTAGVGSGTLYRHFPDRTQLLSEVAKKRFAKVAQVIDAALEVEDAGEALRSALHALAHEVASDRALTELIIAEQLLEFPEMAAFRLRAIRQLDRVAARARDVGAVRDDVSATDLVTLMVAVARLPVPGMGDSTDPDLWERYFTIVLDGLRPDAANTTLPHRAASTRQRRGRKSPPAAPSS